MRELVPFMYGLQKVVDLEQRERMGRMLPGPNIGLGEALFVQ